MKIHIFGASGSGVTTLGQALAAHLSLPYFDSDDYFWLSTDYPYTSPRPAPQRNALIRNDLARAHLTAAEAAAPTLTGAYGAAAQPNPAAPGWILGGSIYRWGDDLFPPFDLIVFLYIPPDIRMARIRAREQQRYGDKLLTDPITIKHHQDFLAWCADYDHDTGIASRTLNAHEAWLKKQTSPILDLRGDFTVPDRLNRTLAALTPPPPSAAAPPYIGSQK